MKLSEETEDDWDEGKELVKLLKVTFRSSTSRGI
jgi:hypothetical protein